MQTRGNLPTAIKVMRARRHLRVLRDQVLAHGPVRRHYPAGVHPLGGQRRRELGRAVLAEPLRRRQRPEAAQGRPARLETPGEADVRGPREKRVFREIIERMGYNPDDAYPKSNYDQWLGYFLGMRVLNEDATKWEPVITWTEADNEKYHASYPAQEGKVAFDQFMADGSYVVERSEGDPRNYVGYRDDKLGIGEDGESVVVADTAWPRRRCPASWRSTASTRPTM